MIRSPSNLELLLHCYYSAVPHPRLHAPAIKDGIDYLLHHHMIMQTPVDNVWKTTDKGEFYIKFLMTVPFPAPIWTIKAPEQSVIIKE